jgi:hypothetical protein
MAQATKRLVMFLIRKKLGLKKYETFQFENQKNKEDFYYFGKTKLIKHSRYIRESNVSLNYLLSDQCKIIKK